MNKTHMIFNALVIFVVWIWLMVSASRLLWLRKHSTNVFVRCSALWRFMFMIAAFYFVTMSPYVAWIIVDFVTKPVVNQSPLWFTKETVTTASNIQEAAGSLSNGEFQESVNSDYVPVVSDVDYLNPLYSMVATGLLLCHLAISPTLYLVRLLGFRRILSALGWILSPVEIVSIYRLLLQASSSVNIRCQWGVWIRILQDAHISKNMNMLF